MRKGIVVTVFLMAALGAFFTCTSDGVKDNDYREITLFVTPEELPDCDGMHPASPEESMLVFIESAGPGIGKAFSDALGDVFDQMFSGLGLNPLFEMENRFQPLDISGNATWDPLSGGTISISGSETVYGKTGSATIDIQTFEIAASYAIEPGIDGVDFDGTGTALVFIEAGFSDYSIDGPTLNGSPTQGGRGIQVSAAADITAAGRGLNFEDDPQGTLSITYNTPPEAGLYIGLSISNPEGFGGKFIISFHFYQPAGTRVIDLSQISSGQDPDLADIFDLLTTDGWTMTLTIEVYDNDDLLIEGASGSFSGYGVIEFIEGLLEGVIL